MEFDMNRNLIEEIKKYEFIYDLKSTDYKNRAKKEKIWESIGNVLGLEVHICQKRWKSLRDTYKKHKLRMRQTPEEYENRRPWSYFECLTFLDNVQSTRRSFGCRTQSTVKGSDEEDTIADFTQTTRDSYTYEQPELYLSSPPQKRSRQSSPESIEDVPHQFEEIYNKPTLSISGIDEKAYDEAAKGKNSTAQLFDALAYKITSSNLTPNQINDMESSVVAFVYQQLSEIQSRSHLAHK